MTPNRCHLFLLITAILVIGIARPASADVATPPSIHALFQEGQDVEVTVLKTPRNPDSTLSIERKIDDTTVVVVSDFEMTVDNAVRRETHCNADFYFDWNGFCVDHPNYCWECTAGSDVQCIGPSCDDCQERATPFLSGVDNLCATFPEYLQDCDEDGTPECCGQCDQYHYYEFVDECVPPGEAFYSVIQLNYSYGAEKIDVVDQDYPDCDAVDAGPVDTGLETESETGGELDSETESDAPDPATPSDTEGPKDTAAPTDTQAAEENDTTSSETGQASASSSDEPLDVPSDTGANSGTGNDVIEDTEDDSQSSNSGTGNDVIEDTKDDSQPSSADNTEETDEAEDNDEDNDNDDDDDEDNDNDDDDSCSVSNIGINAAGSLLKKLTQLLF